MDEIAKRGAIAEVAAQRQQDLRQAHLGDRNGDSGLKRSLGPIHLTLIGVGSIVAMQAVGEGSRREALRLVEGLGLTNLVVEAKTFDETSLRELRARSLGLTRADAQAATTASPVLGCARGRVMSSVWMPPLPAGMATVPPPCHSAADWVASSPVTRALSVVSSGSISKMDTPQSEVRCGLARRSRAHAGFTSARQTGAASARS